MKKDKAMPKSIEMNKKTSIRIRVQKKQRKVPQINQE